ncbi:hypothetical protein V6N13_142812 [Hibiscus sabdariffa]|uniref:Uncharacterized protein n=1 Tax=Hibiscus sabdariffa TaxID=183260 RepID=A0ABR2FFX6_9ROSI
MELDIPSWILVNLSSDKHGGPGTSHWDMLFAAIVWNLWLARNVKIFGTTGDEEGSVIARSQHLLQLTLHSHDTSGVSRFDHSHLASAAMIWSSPSGSFIKVNTDAGRRTFDGFALWWCG